MKAARPRALAGWLVGSLGVFSGMLRRVDWLVGWLVGSLGAILGTRGSPQKVGQQRQQHQALSVALQRVWPAGPPQAAALAPPPAAALRVHWNTAGPVSHTGTPLPGAWTVGSALGAVLLRWEGGSRWAW